MADILEEIVAHKRIEIEQRKHFIAPRQMITLMEQKMKDDDGHTPGGSMCEALMTSTSSTAPSTRQALFISMPSCLPRL